LFSTLSGIAAFGPLGFIIGPILAGLFITSWEIFRESYQDELETESAPLAIVDATSHEPPLADAPVASAELP
jgi:hypothetical protein